MTPRAPKWVITNNWTLESAKVMQIGRKISNRMLRLVLCLAAAVALELAVAFVGAQHAVPGERAWLGVAYQPPVDCRTGFAREVLS